MTQETISTILTVLGTLIGGVITVLGTIYVARGQIEKSRLLGQDAFQRRINELALSLVEPTNEENGRLRARLEMIERRLAVVEGELNDTRKEKIDLLRSNSELRTALNKVSIENAGNKRRVASQERRISKLESKLGTGELAELDDMTTPAPHNLPDIDETPNE